MKTLITCLAFFAVVASCARLPDLQLVEEDLPESLVAFQDAGGANQAENEDLDLGEWDTTICICIWLHRGQGSTPECIIAHRW